jgi:hypothetical protein
MMKIMRVKMKTSSNITNLGLKITLKRRSKRTLTPSIGTTLIMRFCKLKNESLSSKARRPRRGWKRKS